ncbi:MAG: TIGR02757 family protein [Spirochaetaceae bacterium 4572_7]|nr:MAG: TIGR02757 family protein [Spirochaetaceae bacterium 4572_7]
MRDNLNLLYNKYNKKSFIHPDPLETVYRFTNKDDMEVVGLIASSFAIGNLKAMLKFLDSLFIVMGSSPYNFLKDTSIEDLTEIFTDSYYRYYKAPDIIEFLLSIKNIINRYCSIEKWVMTLYRSNDETIVPLMKIMANELNVGSTLIPKSSGNSGFKRLALYFRWMVRNDDVDLGLWKGIPRSKLIIPLDTHIMRISNILGFTSSKTNSMANTLKITAAFRALEPDDPVKWDFSLSRLGIHPDLNYDELIGLFKKN